jgi:nicotinate dehydrogenase subunit A
MPTTLTVNGRTHRLDLDPDTPLLYVLRNDLGLNGPKFGCGLAQCGACTVLVDGRTELSCVTPLSAVAEREIVTLEGLGTRERPHPLQTAFIEEQAMQCGFCVNGVVLTAAALLREDPEPSEARIRRALAGTLCRCGAHGRMVRAIQRAAKATRP